jgi:hypothetical protein
MCFIELLNFTKMALSETMIILRSKTDDALEDFVKAQIYLDLKLKEIETLKKKHEKIADKYDRMSRRSANYLYYNHRKMEYLLQKMQDIQMDIQIEDERAKEMEDACRNAEKALSDARKAEREFLNKSE